MKKIIFIDRDGTLIQEPPLNYQVDNLEQLVLLPMVISSLQKLQKMWYELVIVTNQDWLGTDSNPRKNYELINNKMLEIFSWEGVEFSEVFECPHFPDDNCECRKPKIWILSKKFLEKYGWSTNGFNPLKIDLKSSFMVWDRETDREFAKNIWVKFNKVIFWSEDFNWNNLIKNIKKWNT